MELFASARKTKRIVMPEAPPFLNLKGSLNINVDHNPVKMECEGQYIKLTFTSYYGLRKFFLCSKAIKQTFQPSVIQDFLKKLKLSYYINDVLIGESNNALPLSLLGKYIGLENTKFYLKNFLFHLLGLKFSKPSNEILQ